MAESAPNPADTPNRFWSWVRKLAVIYLLFCLLMTLLESRLVYSPPNPSRSDAQLEQSNRRDVSFSAQDGTLLHGWFYPHDESRYVILYCHGNAEDVTNNTEYMAYLREILQASVFIFDYRGYGNSEGSPHEAGVILDGLAAQQWLADELQIETNEIVLMGRSLGGGVAVALAEQQGAKAVILQNTFADMTEVAAGKFPWLPIRWIMRNRFPSVKRIKTYEGPLLQTHGTADRVIPYAQGKKLFDAAPRKHKQWIENPEGTHNGPLPRTYFDTLAQFLEALPD